MPRLRNNLSANLLGTALSSVVALGSAPLIFRVLGADAYGLVGVYLLLQGLMPLFDLGITPGLARAVAWHNGVGEEGQVRTLVRLAQRPMLALALVFLIGLLAASRFLSRFWLTSNTLDPALIQTALALMGVALAVRMLAGLQKAALMAVEHQVEANLVQSASVILRTLGALAVAQESSSGVLGFFVAQLPVSALEWWAYRHFLRARLRTRELPIALAELRQHRRFAIGVAGLAALWLATSQADKLALSRVLHLADYGGYSLGVHVASAILVATGPIQAAVLPRLTRLVSSRDERQLDVLYGMATVLTLAISAALFVGILLAGPLVLAFIRPAASLDVPPMDIAAWYAAGNCAVVIVGLSYQLQNARGVLRLHALGTIAQAVIQVPLLVWAAVTKGPLLTAIAFAALNWIFLVAWMPIVHRRFLPGGHARWLRRDLLAPLVSVALASVVCYTLRAVVDSPVRSAVVASVAAAGTLAIALLSHSGMRRYLRDGLLRHG